jgi:predicted aspartyl protease
MSTAMQVGCFVRATRLFAPWEPEDTARTRTVQEGTRGVVIELRTMAVLVNFEEVEFTQFVLSSDVLPLQVINTHYK